MEGFFFPSFLFFFSPFFLLASVRNGYGRRVIDRRRRQG